MSSRKAGLALAVIGVAAAAVLFAVLREEDSDTGPASDGSAPKSVADGPAAAEQERSDGNAAGAPIPVIEVRGGEPVGGVRELSFGRGDEIRFRVHSDVADEVHLHGYDIAKPVAAGGDVALAVPAEIEGVFEVELETRGVQLAEVTVTP